MPLIRASERLRKQRRASFAVNEKRFLFCVARRHDQTVLQIRILKHGAQKETRRARRTEKESSVLASYDDPDTGTHAEEIKMQSTTDKEEEQTN
jgi:hypothetical protein